MSDNDSKINILVIDDELNTRDACERILTRMGFNVLTAADGEQGLRLVDSRPVSVILLDLKMPGMDGFTILERIHSKYESILIIVITGYATLESAIEAMKKGAYDFIAKPFEPDGLRIVVTRAVEKLRLTSEARRLEVEQKRILSDLGVERNRTRTLIQSLPTGVLTTNTEARVILINPVFSRQLDLKPDLPLGGPIDDYVSDAGFCDLVRKISSGAYTSTDEIPPYEFSPASNKFLLVRGQPVVNDENEFLGAVMTISDITAIKMLDRIKSEFVAEVSHELRSPLSTIHEQLALVINDGTNGKLSEDIPILSRALEKTHELISLVGDLLDLTRIEAGTVYSEPKPVRVGEMIRKIVDFLSTRVEKRRQHLTVRVPEEGVPEITADPLALESIFGNLITNAINYTQDEGEITVTVAAQPGRLVVEVRDNGFGIEKENQARVFDKFYRIKSEKTKSIPGTGLGLPIVKLLVDNLGGTIDLSSEPGKGSCFTVSLPI